MGGCEFKFRGTCDDSCILHLYLAITLHNFQLLSVVGTGGFGKVYKATLTKNRDLVALKVMSKVRVIQKKSVNSVMNELHILSSLKNEYICNLEY